MRNTGKAWQALLDGVHQDYNRDRLAKIHGCHPPVRLLSRVDADGEFRAKFADEGPPDYNGTVFREPHGLPVSFDAKDTIEERWDFKDLRRHQARDLQATMERRGAAFLAIRTPIGAWVVPWVAFGPLWWPWFKSFAESPTTRKRAASGSASLGTVQLDRLGLRMPRPGDWLPALEQLLAAGRMLEPSERVAP